MSYYILKVLTNEALFPLNDEIPTTNPIRNIYYSAIPRKTISHNILVRFIEDEGHNSDFIADTVEQTITPIKMEQTASKLIIEAAGLN